MVKIEVKTGRARMPPTWRANKTPAEAKLRSGSGNANGLALAVKSH
jgi:hypothetical protein